MEDLKSLKLIDHLVSGDEFQLIWNNHHQCYETSPTPGNLDKYYDSAAYISHTDNTDTIMARIYQRAKQINLNHKLKLVRRYCGRIGKLMDIGAGTGDFVKYAQDRNWEAYGIEPNDLARELAHKKGVPVYKNISVQREAIYDVVTLWHVLEHLPNLDMQVEAISKTLKKDGWIILAVPNYKSLDATYYKDNWAAYDVPRHLWHFSKDSINTIFKDRGYSLRSVKPLLLDAFYISWLSETYKRNPLAPLAGALLGMASNSYGLFSGEYSSHVYILQRTD
jgi:2-polyprenyl-3-methyl-5-hydroxy-6-metoxy-1,4-benzoquinol methylase